MQSSNAPMAIVAVCDAGRRQSIAGLLREMDWCTLECTSGWHVIENLGTQILDDTLSRPDLLILEDVMPGVLGSSIADGVRELGWTTSVVLLGERQPRIRVDPNTLTLGQKARLNTIWQATRILAQEVSPADEFGSEMLESFCETLRDIGHAQWHWNPNADTVQFDDPVGAVIEEVEVGIELSNWMTWVHPEYRPAVAKKLKRLAEGKVRGIEAEVKTAEGDRWMLIRAGRLSGFDGGSIVGSATDITTLKRREQKLSRAADSDVVSSVANRRGFERHLGQTLRRLRRTRKDEFGLLYVDIDDFKSINDTHGHAVGDAVLRMVAKRLQRVVRSEDMVARLGGDEFSVLLHGPQPELRCAEIESRLKSAFETPFVVGDVTLRVSASVGAVVCRDTARRADEILREADAVMYQHKKHRRAQ